MKLAKTLVLAVFSAVMLFACKQDTKQPSVLPDSTASPSPISTARPEIFLYAVMVDKLNLRDQPNKNAQIISQLAEGQFVEGTGEMSANKEEATLRGMTYNEPYFKVVTAAPEQKTGWAYGGALQCVYAGSRAGRPDLEKLARLTGFLKTLDVKKLESGKKAWNFVNTHFADANGVLADAVFVLLERFLRRMGNEGEFYVLTEQFPWTEDDEQAIYENKFDPNKYPLSKSIAESGFHLVTSEGMIFPLTDWHKFQDFFGGKVTPSMKASINQGVIEGDRMAWDDGGIIIPLEELADRAVFWEKFNDENPYFQYSEQTKESERWARLTLVCGADNTPSYDFETQAIEEDFKKVWAYIQQKYPGTELAKTAKEISDLCAAEGWKRTKKVEDWQTKYANED